MSSGTCCILCSFGNALITGLLVVFWFWIVMYEPQVFGLRADSILPFFEISGFGRVRVVQNLLRTGGQAGIYVHTIT